MNAPFLMPDLGEGLIEAVIVAVHVEEGDYVVADQPLVSVETDKAVVEIPSPVAGRLVRFAAIAGQTVKVGQVLAEFDDGGHRPSGSVVGDLPAAVAAPPSVVPAAAHAAAGENRAMPAVRQLARRLGIDLAVLAGSGPGGTITSSDVEAAAAEPNGSEPLAGMRLAMARSLDEAHHSVATATVTDEIDVEAWIAGADITARLVRAIVRAAAAEPSLNAWYDDRRLSRRLHCQVDLGVAMDTPDGLIVPVLKGVDGLDPAALRARLDQVKQLVGRRAIPPEDLRGATITLSNFGLFGIGLTAAMMVVPPQVAIVGCGRIVKRAVEDGERLAMHRHLPLSVTFDHRPVTGGEASRFLAAMMADLC